MDYLHVSYETFMMNITSRLDASNVTLHKVRSSQLSLFEQIGQTNVMLDRINRCMPPPPGGGTDSSNLSSKDSFDT